MLIISLKVKPLPEFYPLPFTNPEGKGLRGIGHQHPINRKSTDSKAKSPLAETASGLRGSTVVYVLGKHLAKKVKPPTATKRNSGALGMPKNSSRTLPTTNMPIAAFKLSIICEQTSELNSG